MPVVDNQRVKKDDILFEIDPIDYQLALQQAEATVLSRRYDMEVQRLEAERRQKLGQAVSLEDRQTSQSSADVAAAAYQSAIRRARPGQGQPPAHHHPLPPPTATSPTSPCASATTPPRARASSPSSTATRSGSTATSRRPSCPTSTRATTPTSA
ncbi:MAG: biotin/lipoyl-binding protein [Verrucomicrobiota bacterium]